MHEDWRDIEGYPGYTVTYSGKVFGPKGQLKPLIRDGNHIVRVWAKSKKKDFYVANLVLNSFSERKKLGKSFAAVHRDGDKSNNNFDNLEWVRRAYTMEVKSEYVFYNIQDMSFVTSKIEDLNVQPYTKFYLAKLMDKKDWYYHPKLDLFVIQLDSVEQFKKELIPKGYMLIDFLDNRYATNIDGDLFSVVTQNFAKQCIDENSFRVCVRKRKFKVRREELKRYYETKTISREGNRADTF